MEDARDPVRERLSQYLVRGRRVLERQLGGAIQSRKGNEGIEEGRRSRI